MENRKRYLYTGGSVQMRDAAIYVRENSWDNAFELWHQAFEGTKNTKKQMRAAFNIAVYYETKDSLSQAVKWAEKAQQLAKKIEKRMLSTMSKRVLTMCRIITSPASIWPN